MLDVYERAVKAVADRSRARILKMLQAGETCVCDLSDALGLAPATVSKHLAVLRRAGFVAVRREHRWSYYRLAPAGAPGGLHASLLTVLDRQLEGDPEVRSDRRHLEALRRGAAGRCRAPRRSGDARDG